MRSMNAPGSPSSPLQTMYLGRPGRGADLGPLGAGGEARAAAAAQTAACDKGGSFRGRELLSAVSQRGEAAVGQVLVEVGGVEVAAVFGRDVHLRPEEGGDGRVGGGDAAAVRLCGGGIAAQPVQCGGTGLAQPAEDVRGGEVAAHDGGAEFGRYAGVADRPAVGEVELDERCVVAHAYATDAFDADLGAVAAQGGAEGLVDAAAAVGYAAGAQADADFAGPGAPGGRVRRGRRWRPAVGRRRGMQDRLEHGVAEQMAVRGAVNLQDGCERAAAHAGDRFERVLAVRVGVGVRGDSEAAAQLVGDPGGAGDVAGRAVADLDYVLADGCVAELRIERRHARELGRRDVRVLADVAQGGGGEIAVVGLHGLQDGDDGGPISAGMRDDLINRRQVDSVGGWLGGGRCRHRLYHGQGNHAGLGRYGGRTCGYQASGAK